ncbi:hypothetical protein NDU88_004312 [Pleurodeles waltl]|uniref:Uncharacterized protein n=1 Tax=Pleurodeles waltl TaxID=8319 RepID=A0AAV7MV38_PLEWA|nr:hypothetical protein NDU88_004312 [Pleurodeles waltl]
MCVASAPRNRRPLQLMQASTARNSRDQKRHAQYSGITRPAGPGPQALIGHLKGDIEVEVAMEVYLDRVRPLKVEPVTKKKSQKRKSMATAETTQENSEGDRRKRKQTVTPLEDVTMKLQNVRVPASLESDTTLNEPGTSCSNNTIIRVMPTQDPLNTPTCFTLQRPSMGSEERALPSTSIHQQDIVTCADSPTNRSSGLIIKKERYR